MKREDLEPYRINFHKGYLRFLERTEDIES